MKTLPQYFQEYAQYHRTPGNKVTHYIGIPLIVISLFGLLSGWVIGDGLTGLEFFRVDAGTILVAVAVLWYLALDWRIAAPFALVLYGCYFLGRAQPSSVLWTAFVLGWVLQFVGHGIYEKKSPAFLTNIEHVLVGPLWVFCSLVRYRP